MAAATLKIGPADHGREMKLDDFIHADFAEGWLYELGRGRVVVTQVPELPHGMVVMRLWDLFCGYSRSHPGMIKYEADKAACAVRLPGLESSRSPDHTIYLSPPPPGDHPWTEWIPALVVEVISKGSSRRDRIEKREEYLRLGVLEYWVIDPKRREMRVHARAGDTWRITDLPPRAIHRPHFLPGLEVRPADLIGPAGEP
jgi:hypothetical protein